MYYIYPLLVQISICFNKGRFLKEQSYSSNNRFPVVLSCWYEAKDAQKFSLFQAAYVRISYKLRYRFAAGFVGGEDGPQKNRRQLRGRRLQKTNLLLGSIAVIFCISWLPLNVFNLVADLSTSQSFTSQSMMVSHINYFASFLFYEYLLCTVPS